MGRRGDVTSPCQRKRVERDFEFPPSRDVLGTFPHNLNCQVDLHGGEIIVESAIGAETTFTVILPFSINLL
jgi:hypothetical protein